MSSSDKNKRQDCNCTMCLETYSHYCTLKGVSCLMCNKKSNVLLKCSACLLVSYCSTECQKKHWHRHKKSCIQYRRDSPCPFTNEKMNQTMDDYIKLKGLPFQRFDLVELAVKIADQSENDNGLYHPETIFWTGSLADLYRSQGKFFDALNSFNKLHLISCTMLGPLHKNSLCKLGDIAVYYLELGNFDEGIKCITKTIKGYEEVLSANPEPEPADIDPQFSTRGYMLTSKLNFSLLQLGNFDFTSAEKTNLEVISEREILLGKDHPSTLLACASLAFLSEIQGRYSEAKQQYSRVYNSLHKNPFLSAASSSTNSHGKEIPYEYSDNTKGHRHYLRKKITEMEALQ